jgi:hypothetical protein
MLAMGRFIRLRTYAVFGAPALDMIRTAPEPVPQRLTRPIEARGTPAERTRSAATSKTRPTASLEKHGDQALAANVGLHPRCAIPNCNDDRRDPGYVR